MEHINIQRANNGFVVNIYKIGGTEEVRGDFTTETLLFLNSGDLMEYLANTLTDVKETEDALG